MGSMVIGAIIGTFISLAVALHFSKTASEELKIEAQKLGHQTTLILRAFEQADIAEFGRDEKVT